MSTTKGGAVAKIKTAAPAIQEQSSTGTALVSAEANDIFAQFAGAGMENIKATDILIPRIGILQALSPQVSSVKPEYIQGAQPGMICDIGTGQLIGESMLFVPVHYTKVWLEWYPRKSGKGLAAIHADARILDECTYDERRRPFLPNDNYVSETAQLFGLMLDEEGRVRQAFIPFASTQIKKCKRLLTLATGERVMTSRGEITPPLFYRAYIFNTVHESNSEGDWHGWKIERGPAVTETPNPPRVIEAAIKMRRQIDEGIVKADMTSDEAMEAMSAANAEDGRM